MWIRYADLWIRLGVGAVVLVLAGLAAALFVFSGSDDETPVGTTGVSIPTPTPKVASLGNVTFTVAAASQRQFSWPAEGGIRRYFGTAGSSGIDIALDGGETPVRASAAGKVTFAAGNPCCEYGLTVIVDHGNGYTSLYGNLAEMLVSVGQDVKQGDWLGLGGQTGNAPAKQLHFELRRGNEYVDPLRFLAYQERNAYTVQTAQCPGETLRIDVASTVAVTFLPTSTLDFQVESAKLSLRSGPEIAVKPVVKVQNNESVSITVSEAPTANGDAFRYYLETVLRQGEATTTMTCTLELAYRRTLPNPEEPQPVAERPSVPQAPIDEPPPAPTATPKPAAKAPTATASKPAVSPTATPRGIKTPTPRTGPQPKY